MIVFLANPWLTGGVTAAVLAVEAWVLNGHHLPHPHLPSGVLSVLAAPVLAALVFIVATTETERLTTRRNARAGGDR